jgi:hypothetical protein
MPVSVLVRFLAFNSTAYVIGMQNRIPLGGNMRHGLALKFSGSSAVRGLIPPMLVNVPE